MGDGRSLVSSLDEIEVVVVGADESHWRRLMVTGGGVVDVDGCDGREVVMMGSVTDGFDSLGLVVDGSLDEMALTV